MYLAKVVLLGDSSTGKSELRERFLGVGFQANYLLTIGADFAVKRVEDLGEKVIKFQFWDLSGQQRFNSVRSLYYSGSHGAILVYDVTRPETYSNIVQWVGELQQHVRSQPVPCVLVGNRAGMRDPDNPAHITVEQGILLAQLISDTMSHGQIPVPYFETNPETGENINEMFLALASLVTYIANPTDASATLILNLARHIPLHGRAEYSTRSDVQSLVNAQLSRVEELLSSISHINEQALLPSSEQSLGMVNNLSSQLNIIKLTCVQINDFVKLLQRNTRTKSLGVFNQLLHAIESALDQVTSSMQRLDQLRVVHQELARVRRAKGTVASLKQELWGLFMDLSEKQSLTLKEGQAIRIKLGKIQSAVEQTQPYTGTDPTIISIIREENVTLEQDILELASLSADLGAQVRERVDELESLLNARIKILEKNTHEHKIICFGDRAPIPAQELSRSYHCPVCHIYLCEFCWQVLASHNHICPGSAYTRKHDFASLPR